MTALSHTPLECFVYAADEYNMKSLPGEYMKVGNVKIKCIHHIHDQSYRFRNMNVLGPYHMAEAVARVNARVRIPVILAVVRGGHVILKVRFDKRLLAILDEKERKNEEETGRSAYGPILDSLRRSGTRFADYPASHVLERHSVA